MSFDGAASYLCERKIRIFDYPKFAEPFRNRLRENAERLAADNGIEIEFLRKRNARKEDRDKAVSTLGGVLPVPRAFDGRYSSRISSG